MSDDERIQLESYLPRLYGYAMSLCREPELAKDLVQDCALKALGAKRIPDDQAAYRAWLFRILKNTFLDSIRRRKVAEAWVNEEIEITPASMEYSTLDERFITALTVKREIDRLPALQREIIGLIDVAGLSYAEAASVLDVPTGTIMSRISRARGVLMGAIAVGDGSDMDDACIDNVHPLPVRKRK